MRLYKGVDKWKWVRFAERSHISHLEELEEFEKSKVSSLWNRGLSEGLPGAEMKYNTKMSHVDT